MAYLHTEAKAASNGEYGRGGSGSVRLVWHNMPDATVELLPAEDSRGDIEIRWHVRPEWEGVLADLNVDEARILRNNLNSAITRFLSTTGSSVTDNDVDDAVTVNVDGTVLTLPGEPTFCQTCNGRIGLLHNGSEYWWTHEPYSINDHEPAVAMVCAVCDDTIVAAENGSYRWWHRTYPEDDHRAVPAWAVRAAAEEVA
ncbi:hypothetical protein LTV02_17945 [Nocardia yamanashiensis]|uniref:hypothetical protein n=1 Tax=Nocardia yamanashiensis TaxID=209247 RepID=UPI001E3A4E60|nr:hypothetical protein [Nocardia yamanashiensis]UGT45154.1 hypothetical protein LTV02_17945 [Nocardia yamanashiensis]